MFERKNQSVLTPHYSGLIHHDAAEDDDDFITLKARDHGLDDLDASTTPTDKLGEPSKRKLKMGESKKAMLKMKGLGQKVVFDDQGEAHELYEMDDLDEFKKDGDAKAQRDAYLERERENMRTAMVIDRQVEKEKRLEKKRKRKAREREVRVTVCPVPSSCADRGRVHRPWRRRWARVQFWGMQARPKITARQRATRSRRLPLSGPRSLSKTTMETKLPWLSDYSAEHRRRVCAACCMQLFKCYTSVASIPVTRSGMGMSLSGGVDHTRWAIMRM